MARNASAFSAVLIQEQMKLSCLLRLIGDRGKEPLCFLLGEGVKIFVPGEMDCEREKNCFPSARKHGKLKGRGKTTNAAKAYRDNFLLFVTVWLFRFLLFLSSSTTEGGYDDHNNYSPTEGDHDDDHHYVPGWDAA